MRKPNYRFERAERDRLRQAKKEERAKRQQQERASDQKSDEAGQPAPIGGERQLHDITPVCVTSGFLVRAS